MTGSSAATGPTIAATGFFALDVVVAEEEDAPVTEQAGGTCGNVLAILAYLGWKSLAISRMSIDMVSHAASADMLQCGVDLSFAHAVPEAPLTLIQQRNWTTRDGKKKHRFFWSCPYCQKRSAPYRPLTLTGALAVLRQMAAPQVFFVDRLSPASVLLAERFHEAGALVMFEPSGRIDPALLQRMMQCVGIVKYPPLYDKQMHDACRGPRQSKCVEIRTEGSSGLSYRVHAAGEDPGKWRHVSATGVGHLVDASGAGDWCTAGILMLLGKRGRGGLEREDEGRILEGMVAGRDLASLNCRYLGARGAMSALGKGEILNMVGRCDGEAPLLKSNRDAQVFRGCSPECVAARVEALPHLNRPRILAEMHIQ
jgi:hypothetical protein